MANLNDIDDLKLKQQGLRNKLSSCLSNNDINKIKTDLNYAKNLSSMAVQKAGYINSTSFNGFQRTSLPSLRILPRLLPSMASLNSASVRNDQAQIDNMIRSTAALNDMGQIKEKVGAIISRLDALISKTGQMRIEAQSFFQNRL